MTFDDIHKLPEGTYLRYKKIDGQFIIGKLHYHEIRDNNYHEKCEAVFCFNSTAWAIKHTDLYSIASDEEAMLWKLENS